LTAWVPTPFNPSGFSDFHQPHEQYCTPFLRGLAAEAVSKSASLTQLGTHFLRKFTFAGCWRPENIYCQRGVVSLEIAQLHRTVRRVNGFYLQLNA
jgi:hypothetical protein